MPRRSCSRAFGSTVAAVSAAEAETAASGEESEGFGIASRDL